MLRLFAPPNPAPHAQPGTAARIVHAYLLHLQARVQADDYSSHGFNVIKSDLVRFAAFLGPLEPAKGDLPTFFQANPQIRAPGTKDRFIKEVLACWHWAADEAELTDFCYRRPKTLRAGKSPPRRECTATEWRVLMAKAPEYLRDAILFLDATGCRPGEMRKARWSEVLWAESILEISDHKTRRKTGQSRPIGLNRAAMRLLRRRHRQAHDKSGYIFIGPKGKPWKGETSFQNYFRKWVIRLGLDLGNGKRLTAACFRNTWVGRALNRDICERKIADQLGHTTTALVHHYGAQRKKRQALPVTADLASR